MKILYILPLVWMLVFTSCNSDFLDREPSNKYTDDAAERYVAPHLYQL